MTLDDVTAGRLGRLERDYGGLSARVAGLERDVGSILPMVSEFATLNERVKNFGSDLAEIKLAVVKQEQEREQERKETQRDRRVMVRWAITLTVTIVAALIGLFGAILSAGGHL